MFLRSSDVPQAMQVNRLSTNLSDDLECVGDDGMTSLGISSCGSIYCFDNLDSRNA